jgi:membrane fusion protein, multidrug efflux system
MAEIAKDKGAPRRRRRWGRIVVVFAVIAVVAIGGYFLWRYFNTYESTDDAQIDGHINAISARITGHVEAVMAEDEQYVQQGDVLVRIDPRDYQVAVAQAEADLRNAEAELESSRINVPITDRTTASTLKSATSGRGDAAAALNGARSR